jgi:glycosyltransferase involved in cell wall biosynthesis
MNLSVDIHSLVLEQTNRDWVNKMRDSVQVAIERSPFPVHYHEVNGVLGNLGLVRAKGYSLGQAPYVTFVDDDDYLLPEAFEVVAEALAQQPAAVFPAEHTLQNGQLTYYMRRHHLPLYRRELIINHEQFPEDGDCRQVQTVERSGLPMIDLPTSVYVYRLRLNSPARILRRELMRQGQRSPK